MLSFLFTADEDGVHNKAWSDIKIWFGWLQDAIDDYNASLNGTKPSISNFITSLKQSKVNAEAAGEATEGFSLKLLALRAKALLLNAVLGVGIGLLVSWGTKKITEASQRVQNVATKSKEAADAAQSTTSSLKDLVSAYEELGDKSGWDTEDFDQAYGVTSVYVGYSMHDIQDEIIQAKKKLNDSFNKEFEKVSVQRINVFSKNQDVHWFNQGCFSISSNGFTYNATTNTVQCSCVDLVARLNGDLAGQLTGLKTKINKGTRIAPVIKTVLTEQPMSEFSKCVIDYWTRNVPYDLEYETGTTLWQILTELRDLYYPFEMYFDDDVFVCHEIPSGFDDPPVLDPDLFASLVTADGESATVDYSTVRNCVEVFGATIDSDAYSSTATYSSEKNSLTLTVKELAVDDEANISFIMPAKITSKTLNIIVNFVTTEVKTDGSGGTEQKTTTKTSLLYKSVPNADGNDVEQEPSIMEAGKYYVIQWFPDTKHFYFIGQQQSHAMVKLVDTVPTGDKLAAEKKEENCDNLEYVCMTDPDNIDDLYNAKFSIEKIGRRNEILSGGDYDNYTTDEKAMEVAKYELWKKARLTDGLVVPILLVPWLDVNEKIQYAAKYLNSKTPVDWIIKSFSINLGEGTMSLTMSRYFPYYPYIVGHSKEEKSKYDIYQDWMLDQYFPDLRSDVNKNNNPTTTT